MTDGYTNERTDIYTSRVAFATENFQMTDIYLSSCIFSVGEKRAAGESVDPVMVPEAVQETLVHGGLEVGHIQGVILTGVHAKVFNLVQGNSLVFIRSNIWRFEAFGIGSEGSEVDFASGDCPDGIHHDGDKWVLEVLVQHLSGNINTRQPAAISYNI